MRSTKIPLCTPLYHLASLSSASVHHRFAARALANRKHVPRQAVAGLEAFSSLLSAEEFGLLEASRGQRQGGAGGQR